MASQRNQWDNSKNCNRTPLRNRISFAPKLALGQDNYGAV